MEKQLVVEWGNRMHRKACTGIIGP